MRRRRVFASAAVLVLGPAFGQSPSGYPLRLVFPFPAGGAGDALARLLADDLKVALDRPVVVENRTGAAGRIGVQSVRDGAPDAASLLLTPSAPMVVYPHLYPNLGYEPARDFIPLARVAAFEMAIVAGAAVPAGTVTELHQWLKANPNKASYGTPGAGTLAHLVMSALSGHWSLPLVHVPYRGTPPALVDVASGQLALACSAIGEMLTAHKAGRIRILATSGAERSAFAPEVPTLRESGVPFTALNWYGVYGSVKGPQELAARASVALLATVRSEAFRQKALALGFQSAPADGDALARLQHEESRFWADVIRAGNIRAES
jgi:tripartite-type tricarboxylate transporter receptor subunit TctC